MHWVLIYSFSRKYCLWQTAADFSVTIGGLDNSREKETRSQIIEGQKTQYRCSTVTTWFPGIELGGQSSSLVAHWFLVQIPMGRKKVLFCFWVVISWLPFTLKLIRYYAKWLIHELSRDISGRNYTLIFRVGITVLQYSAEWLNSAFRFWFIWPSG